MGFQDILLLVLSSFVAGWLNAIAGGGTILTYSALVAAGVSPIASNATSSVVTFLGSVASVVADHKRFKASTRRLWLLALASIVGGGLGGALAIWSSDRMFAHLVPWLILAATIIFACANQVKSRLKTMHGHERALWIALLTQGLISVYGGYFSAGMGVMMLASLSLTEGGAYNDVNAAKNLLSIILQSAAVVVFLVSGSVNIERLPIMAVACILGGWLGVVFASNVPERVIRWIVVITGCVLAGWTFMR